MIRMLEERDAAQCLAIYNHYILHSTATFETKPLQYAEYLQRIKDVTGRYPWIVLCEDDRVLGYAYLSPFIARSAYDWTADVAVYLDPAARGKGYGTALMEALSGLARKDGYYHLVSIITDTNTESIRLHEKTGFIKAAHFKKFGFKFGEWLGVFYYIKQLRETNGEENVSPPLNLTL